MSEKKDNTLTYVLFGAGLLTIAYAVFAQTDNGSNNNGSNTQIPPNATINTQWGQWQNTTGQPVWVTATGIAVTAAGTLLGPISQLVAALQNNNTSGGSSGGGSSSGGGGGVGKRKAIGEILTGRYYNPLPGGFI